MKRLLRILAALLLLASPSLASAYDFAVDGIYYNILSKSDLTVELTWSPDTYYGDMVIPESVTYGGNTFSVTGIGNYSFLYCTSLTSVNIPDAVTSIGDSAFYSCTSLTSITIPDAVTSIGAWAFFYCTSLTSITLPENLTSISNFAFYQCSSLTSVIFPDNITSTGKYMFAWCTSLTDVTLPDELTCIESNTFFKCTSLDTISLPDNLTSIGNYAFYGCTGLYNITLPNALTSIGNGAFQYSTNLTDIYSLNATPPSCGTDCFSEDTYTSATLHVPSESVSDYKSATIWENFSTISGENFSGEESPFEEDGINYSIISSREVKVISGDYEGSITIPETVTHNGYTYTVTAIGDSAFYFCTSLTSITIGDAVTTIGTYAFGLCISLTDVELEEGLLTIGSKAFLSCISLETLTLPESVTSLGNNTFYNCKKLVSINIPSGVTYLNYSSFYGCSSLTSITIPSSVTGMGTGVFYGCTSLTDVYCMRTTAPSCYVSSSYSDTFSESTYSDATLHVPSGSSSSYASATTWEKFTNIVEDATAVNRVSADAEEAQPTGYYSLSGQRLDAPAEGAVTIIRYSDGTAKKVFLK